MFNLPDEYSINKQITISTMIPKEIKPNERKKLREGLLQIELTDQIQGETISSVINDDVNCQVIIFLNVKLSTVKSAQFIASILQEKIKPYCVIRFYDQVNEVYSFAHKRLSKIDSEEIVIDNMFLTKSMLIAINDEQKKLMNQYISYEAMFNKTTKLAFYLEMSIKTYMISNLKLYSKTTSLLESEIWLNEDDMRSIYEALISIEKLKNELLKADRAADKVRINGDLKEIMQQLDEKLEE